MSFIGAGTIGSGVAGELMTAPEAIQEVYGALTVLNGKDVFSRIRGSEFLEPFTRNVFGGNGYTEKKREMMVYGRKGGDGDYRNTIKRKPKAYTKQYNIEDTTVGDVDFTNNMIEEAMKNNQPLSNLVQPIMEGIAQWYLTRYLPYSPYISLLEIPESGGNFHAQNGMLLDVEVPDYYLKPGQSTTRNHWMTIANSSGVEAEDINAGIERLAGYIDTMESDVVIYGSSTTLAQLYTIYNEPANQDIFWRTGEPMTTIGAAQFIKNDMLPKDFLLFVNGGTDHLLTRNQESDPNFRGLRRYMEQGVVKFEDEMDLIGNKFKVGAEGWFMDGRSDALLMDINKNRSNSDRIMQEAGFTAVQSFADSLETRIDDTLRR